MTFRERFGVHPLLATYRVGAHTIHGALDAPDCLCVWAKADSAFFWAGDREVELTGRETQEEIQALIVALGMDLLRECLGGGEDHV